VDSLKPVNRPTPPPHGSDDDPDKSGIRSIQQPVRRLRVLDVIVSALAGTVAISLYETFAPQSAQICNLHLGLGFKIPAIAILAGLIAGLTFLLLRKTSHH
jgi:hypothetical protein